MKITIGTLSYGIAALSFLLLSIILVTSWRGRFQGALLAAATVVTFLWALALAFVHVPGLGGPYLSHSFEILRSGFWIAFLMKLLSLPERNQVISRRLEKPLFGLLIFACLAIALPGMMVSDSAESILWSTIVGPLMLAITGMVLVEQLFRHTRAEHRWGIKFLCLGIGGLFAYDFYMYSDALLFRGIDGELWQARGVVNALVMPLIAVSAARNPQWSLDVFVSRRAVFHTTAVLAAGLYLLSMAAAGYYIRTFGGEWGRIIQVVFLFGAALLLLVLMFSGTLRARLRVFLSKHFFNYRYDYREEWLNFTQTLTEGEPGVRIRERSIQAIAKLVESPGGALWLAHEQYGYTRVAHWNMPHAQGVEPASGELEIFLKEREWVINLDEYASNPELYGDLPLPRWLTAIPHAWLVVPLIAHQHLMGFIVLARSLANATINWEVSDLLKTAGRQAASYLSQVEAAEQLMIARQFESFNRVSAFIVHDLKNMVAQLSLLLANAERHKHNPVFQEDMLSTIENSVAKMRKLLSQLSEAGQTRGVAQRVELPKLLEGVAQAYAQHTPRPIFISDCANFAVWAEPERLSKVIAHLLQNAIEATPESGQVKLRLGCQGEGATIEIEDTGCGMSEQFIRERLFRPFATTKTTGMGIGVYEAKEAILELGGRVEVTSTVGKGSAFKVWLPCAKMTDENLMEKAN